MNVKIRLAAAGVCLVLLAVGVGALTHTPDMLDRSQWLLVACGVWVLFAAGLLLVFTLPKRAAVILVLMGGFALPLIAGLAPPRSSDDLFRYLWDGRVQVSGVDPYRYAPADPELLGLRDDYLWPRESAWCVQSGDTDASNGRPLTPGCTRINRPRVHTIYPPVAQAYFTTVHIVSPRGGGERPMQLWAAAFAFATTCLLVWALPRLGRDPRWAAAWAWCPLVAFEAANNAHVDVVAAFLAALALLVLARAATTKRVLAGGAILGLAIAVKLTPALLGPAVIRRRPIALIAGVAGALGLVYLPHVLAVGPGVLGYIPGYLQEEGYESGTRFGLLLAVVTPETATLAAAALLATVTALVVWRGNPDRPWHGALTMTGAALLITTPQYPWYALLLVMLVAYAGRPEWLTIALAGYIAQYADRLGLSALEGEQLGYGTALVAITITVLARQRPRRMVVDQEK